MEDPEEKLIAPTDLRGHGELILLVDDNDSVRNALATLLEWSGYRVLQAHGGLEALELARDCGASIDVLITDVIMPKMSGLEMAERLWTAQPGLMVLFMSGYSEEMIGRPGVIDSRSAFLSKPARMRELLQTIRELLGRIQKQ